MGHMILRYGLDPQTGLPRLARVGGVFEESARRLMEGAIAERYAELIHADRQVVRLRFGRGQDQTARFRVRVRRGATPRCPTLILERVRGTVPRQERSDRAPEVPAEWVEGLREQLHEAACHGWLLDGATEEEILAFTALMEKLSTLARTRPDLVAPLLGAGYLALMKRSARQQGTSAGQEHPRAWRYLQRLLRNRQEKKGKRQVETASRDRAHQ